MGSNLFNFKFDGKLTFQEVKDSFDRKLSDARDQYSDKSDFHGCQGVKEFGKTFDSMDEAYD